MRCRLEGEGDWVVMAMAMFEEKQMHCGVLGICTDCIDCHLHIENR